MIHAYEKTVLPNGLRIVTAYRPQLYSVAISLYIGAGSRYERDQEAGISHFVEHLCFKGTHRHPTPKDVAELVDAIGGDVNGGTDREMTVFYAKVIRDDFLAALGLLLELVSQPLLDPEEMEKERQVVLEELAAVEDSPAQLVDVLVDSALWPNNPLGRDVAGTKQSVQAITREQVVEFLHHQYVPNNLVMAVVGNIPHQEVVDAIWAQAGRWPGGSPHPWIPAGDGPGPKVIVRHKETEQAHLALAVPALPLGHPDRYAVTLLSIALGEGMSSRLFLELRERRGLVYDVHSYALHFQDTGALGIYAGTDPQKAPSVVSLVVEELARLSQDGIAEEELERARKMAKSRLFLRLEDTRHLAGWLGGQELLLGGIRTPQEVVAEIERVRPEDVKRVAQKLFRPEAIRMAAVGPFSSGEPFVSLLGGYEGGQKGHQGT